MSVFYIILPLALLLGGGAIAAYVWSVRSGQLDDLDTPSVRLLHDDTAPRPAREPAPPTAPASERSGP